MNVFTQENSMKDVSPKVHDKAVFNIKNCSDLSP